MSPPRRLATASAPIEACGGTAARESSTTRTSEVVGVRVDLTSGVDFGVEVGEDDGVTGLEAVADLGEAGAGASDLDGLGLGADPHRGRARWSRWSG